VEGDCHVGVPPRNDGDVEGDCHVGVPPRNDGDVEGDLIVKYTTSSTYGRQVAGDQ